MTTSVFERYRHSDRSQDRSLDLAQPDLGECAPEWRTIELLLAQHAPMTPDPACATWFSGRGEFGVLLARPDDS